MTTQEELVRALKLVLALHDQEDEQACPGFEGFRLDPKAEEQVRDAVKRAGDSPDTLLIDDVLHFISNHKPLAISGLFPDAARDYTDEWIDRDPFTFWCKLDLSNRRRLARMATQFYREPEPPVRPMSFEPQCSEACDRMTDLEHEEHHGNQARQWEEDRRGVMAAGLSRRESKPRRIG